MTTIRHHEPQSNFERYAFLFMRLSGIALLLLAVGHMVLQHVLRDVHSLTLQVVQDIWRSWGWRVYDLLLLAFAVTHGFNGLRQVIRDYVQQPGRVVWIERALVVITIITIVWSTVAIMTFNPDAVMVEAGS